MATNSYNGRRVYLVDAARTPFLKSRGKPGPFSAGDLALNAGRQLLSRQTFSPEVIDELVLGCAMPSENEANIGRVVALRLGCSEQMPAWTVQRNCASGMQALDSAIKDIACGRHNLVLAGGAEAMSRAPLILRPSMVCWLVDWQKAKSISAKARCLMQLRPGQFAPIIALLKGLTDPIVGMSMPATAELVAHKFSITREDMDAYALQSHQRAVAAQESGFLKALQPIIDGKGKAYLQDDGVRADTTLDKLAGLRPILDKRYGIVTAGNSSQVSDGGAMCLLASEEAVERYGLTPQACIVDMQWSACDPKVMGLGPVFASSTLLQRNNLKTEDIDFWELNEAFAAQVLGCTRAWSDPEFNREFLGRDTPWSPIAMDKLNVDGGAVSMGHPVGASGARIAAHCASVLQRNNAKRGIATICIGGGQGGAMLIERV